jgi:cytochrome c biogenesis protein CcdA
MKKSRLVFGMGIALLFIYLGYYLYFVKAGQSDTTQPGLLKVVGLISMIFFGGLVMLTSIRLIRQSSR